MSKCIFTISFSFFLAITLFAQQRFNAGAFIGFNASQIEGDNHIGYNKFGIYGGLKGIARLSEQWDIHAELLISQIGSKSNNVPDNALSRRFKKPVNITLLYGEIPFLIAYKTAPTWSGDYILDLMGGFSYGRLIKQNVTETIYSLSDATEVRYTDTAKEFNKNSVRLIIGGNLRITSNVSLGIRHTFELTPLYRNKHNMPARPAKLSPYYFSFFALYVL